MNREEIEGKLVVLDSRRRDAQERLERSAARLEELEQERASLLGDYHLAERAAADYTEHLERMQKELAAVEVSEARDAVRERVDARDAAIEKGAAAAAQLVAAFERLDRARADLRNAHQHLRAIDLEAPKGLPPEPQAFDEQWRGLAPMVEAELRVRLESELVEAAVRSPNTMVMRDLPEHLRELARQRKNDLRQAALRRGTEKAR
jgi:chromosome segregation ATPase